MADRFTFTGLSQLGYFQYRDLDSQQMLIADPGESYAIAAVEAGLAVPPPDGRWVAAAGGGAPAPPRPPVPPMAPVSTSIPAPAAAEGGEQ